MGSLLGGVAKFYQAQLHRHPEAVALTGSSLLVYVRFQAGQEPRPAADTINRRVSVVERALRCQFPDAAAQITPVPKRVVIPLSIDEVARFWSSFQTSRDLAIVGLMLLQALRSCEVLALNHDDLFWRKRRSTIGVAAAFAA